MDRLATPESGHQPSTNSRTAAGRHNRHRRDFCVQPAHGPLTALRRTPHRRHGCCPLRLATACFCAGGIWAARALQTSLQTKLSMGGTISEQVLRTRAKLGRHSTERVLVGAHGERFSTTNADSKLLPFKLSPTQRGPERQCAGASSTAPKHCCELRWENHAQRAPPLPSRHVLPGSTPKCSSQPGHRRILATPLPMLKAAAVRAKHNEEVLAAAWAAAAAATTEPRPGPQPQQPPATQQPPPPPPPLQSPSPPPHPLAPAGPAPWRCCGHSTAEAGCSGSVATGDRGHAAESNSNRLQRSSGAGLGGRACRATANRRQPTGNSQHRQPTLSAIRSERKLARSPPQWSGTLAHQAWWAAGTRSPLVRSKVRSSASACIG